jgi:type VI secretion system (T6SS) effector TldE1-like protein
LARIGVGSTAAGLAALAIGFLSYMWLTRDTGPASIGSRTEARDLSGSGTIHQKWVGLGTAGSYIGDDDGGASFDRAHFASLQAGGNSEFAINEPDNRSAPPLSRLPFGERFSFDQSAPSGGSLQSSQPSVSFRDRFIGEALASSFIGEVLGPSAPVWSATDPDPPRAAVPRVTMAAAAQRRDARSGATSKRQSESDFRLASASDTSLAIAYAPSHSVKDSSSTGSPLKGLTPKESDPLADIDPSRTAIYDITARTVYLPNGRRLEAHSGLGDHMDDPRYVNARGTGPTPPNVYELKLRETLFHGVRAIRLVPSDSSKMYGRDGILAHSYLLGPNGQSNGCVSFSDYPAFLDAFQRGDVNRLVVVERLADTPSPKTLADWFSNTLRDIFRGS